jgi:hypothetical protein
MIKFFEKSLKYKILKKKKNRWLFSETTGKKMLTISKS